MLLYIDVISLLSNFVKIIKSKLSLNNLSTTKNECGIKTQLTFNFLLCVKNVDIFLSQKTRSSNTTKLILFLSILSKLTSLI